MTALLALSASCSPPQTTLSIQVQDEPDRVVKIVGQVNLPDQAQLLIAMQREGDRSPIVQGLPLVKSGAFEQILKVPASTPSGNYQVIATFNPQSFDWSGGKVTEIVGKRGENLSGPQVVKSGEMNQLQAIARFQFDGK